MIKWFKKKSPTPLVELSWFRTRDVPSCLSSPPFPSLPLRCWYDPKAQRFVCLGKENILWGQVKQDVLECGPSLLLALCYNAHCWATHMRACTHTHACMHAETHMHTHTHMDKWICMVLCVCVRACVCTPDMSYLTTTATFWEIPLWQASRLYLP